jgi:hypothetical protein
MKKLIRDLLGRSHRYCGEGFSMSEKSLARTVFPEAVVEGLGYYVYRLVDPRDKRTFYVGKGRGNRIFQHVAEAAELPDRSSLKLERIREVESSGHRVQYIIHRYGLTEVEALLVESALIDAYEELSNAQLGHGTHANGVTTVDDLIALYDAGAAEVDVPAVLLNLNRQYDRALTAEQLYERTRGYWVMRPDRHSDVKFAMAVAFGVIREVYRIDQWERSPVEEIVVSGLRRFDRVESKAKYRWTFTGTVAADIRHRFVGKSVGATSQNPVRWMNC